MLDSSPGPALLATLASPRRQEILRLVWAEERSAGDIARAMPDVTFGAVSLQLRSLSLAGLVDVRTESRNRFYNPTKWTEEDSTTRREPTLKMRRLANEIRRGNPDMETRIIKR